MRLCSNSNTGVTFHCAKCQSNTWRSWPVIRPDRRFCFVTEYGVRAGSSSLCFVSLLIPLAAIRGGQPVTSRYCYLLLQPKTKDTCPYQMNI